MTPGWYHHHCDCCGEPGLFVVGNGSAGVRMLDPDTGAEVWALGGVNSLCAGVNPLSGNIIFWGIVPTNWQGGSYPDNTGFGQYEAYFTLNASDGTVIDHVQSPGYIFSTTIPPNFFFSVTSSGVVGPAFLWRDVVGEASDVIAALQLNASDEFSVKWYTTDLNDAGTYALVSALPDGYFYSATGVGGLRTRISASSGPPEDWSDSSVGAWGVAAPVDGTRTVYFAGNDYSELNMSTGSLPSFSGFTPVLSFSVHQSAVAMSSYINDDGDLMAYAAGDGATGRGVALINIDDETLDQEITLDTAVHPNRRFIYSVFHDPIRNAVFAGGERTNLWPGSGGAYANVWSFSEDLSTINWAYDTGNNSHDVRHVVRGWRWGR